MNEETLFGEELRGWLRDALSHGDIDFGELLRRLPGVDPITVRASVQANHLMHRVEWIEQCDLEMDCEPRLPIPHPLEFDWRFASATLSALTDELADTTTGLALLGTPSLWMSLRDRQPAGGPILLDANPLLSAIETHRPHGLFTLDVLTDPLPHLAADIVVADPPWYPEALKGFLWAASSLLRPGGRVVLSVPPFGARPGVRREREDLLVWAARCGLSLRSTRSDLRYAMPPFERAAFRAAGLLSYVPFDWRSGDRLSFVRTGDLSCSRPLAVGRRWTERTLEGVRVQIDRDAPSTGDDPRLVSIIDGDVLPSVSRRDSRRAGARVWTSGNRVFGCAAPARLIDTIDALLAGGALSPAALPAADQVRALVESEREEYMDSQDESRVLVSQAPT